MANKELENKLVNIIKDGFSKFEAKKKAYKIISLFDQFHHNESFECKYPNMKWGDCHDDEREYCEGCEYYKLKS